MLEEIEELKTKRRKLEICAKDMLKSCEEFADKAEKTQNFTFLAKSNALRRSAKEKSAEAEAVEVEINQKLQEIKNQ